MESNKYQCIVVGGGAAGITAATYLAKSGVRTLLIEKNDTCGGLISTFSHNGFSFDAGIRAFEDAGVIIPMLLDLGLDINTIKSPVSLGIANEIIHVDSTENLRDYAEMLKRLYPDSQHEVDIIIQEIQKAVTYLQALYGVMNPLFKDTKRDLAYLFKELLPWLPKYFRTVAKIKKMNAPFEEHFGEKVQNRSLFDVVFQHFFKQTPAFFALSYFYLYPDYFYPLGGMGVLAKVITNKFIELGGHIEYTTTARKANAREQFVEVHDGKKFYYDSLIWAGDLKTLYQSTNPDGLPTDVLKNFENKRQQALSARGGESVFSIFMEVDEPPQTFQAVSNSHFFYTPSKKGLGEVHRSEYQNLLDHWENTSREEILHWLDRFINLNTFEISIPAAKDPSLAPPGKTGLISSFLMDYEIFRLIKKDGWYQEFKSEIEERVVQVLSSSIYPFLRDKILHKFSFSPISIHDRVLSSEGAITGWAFDRNMPSVNAMHKMNKAVFTPVPNIFIAGQWSFSPSGVPMSILTGRLAVNQALKSLKKSGETSKSPTG